jgi:MFS family permease
MSVANGMGAVAGYGLLFWLPSVFRRSLGLELFEISLFYGTIVLFGGIGGIWLGGWLGDRLGKRNPAFYALVPAILVAAAAPFNAAALFAPSLAMAYVLFLIPNGLGLSWAGPVTAAVQGVAPPKMRATASAIFLFFTNLIGLGFGSLFLGWLSDRLTAQHGVEALRYAILYGLVFYLIGGALYALAALRVARDWHRG